MNQYITGATIKELRESKHMTQSELAEKLSVSDKTISKWETGKGLPDISIVESLAKALGISVIELFSGDCNINKNRSFNMLKSKFYVCPVCGNVIYASGEATISCCGVLLPPLESEKDDALHQPEIEIVEDEYFLRFNHEMSKSHYISFVAGLYDDGIHIIKLYPEGNAEARLKISRLKQIYVYCIKDGLFAYYLKKLIK